MTVNPDSIRKLQKDHPLPDLPDEQVIEQFHGKQVVDRFAFLHDLDSETTQAWTEANTRRFDAFAAGLEGREELAENLGEFFSASSESLLVKRGKTYFSAYSDGESSQFVIQVRDTPDGPPRVLLNPNKLDAGGTTSIAFYSPSPDGKYLAYALSENGTDATTLKIMDVATGKDLVAQTMRKPEAEEATLTHEQDGTREAEMLRMTGDSALNSPDTLGEFNNIQFVWDNDSKGFHYVHHHMEERNRRVIYHHEIGTPMETDEVKFDLNVVGSYLKLHSVLDEHGQTTGRNYISLHSGTARNNGLYMQQEGENAGYDKVFDDGVSFFNPIRQVDGKLYVHTNHEAPMGKVVAVDPENPQPENWQTIIAENKQDTLQAVSFFRGKLFATSLHDAATKISVHAADGKHLHDVPLPEQTTSQIYFVNPEANSAMIHISGFRSPGNVYEYDIETNQMQLYKKSEHTQNLDDAVLERVYATSKDGTQVPMTIIRGKDTKLDGSAAVMMTGYGGFNTPLTPSFRPEAYNWVKQGGIFVQTNLRGGGEFGKEWYDGGRLHNKQNVFDDFAACAEQLIEQGYTSPERLAISGGSNGGLLTLATMLQRPELFGAVVATVPVADMLHETNWESDYGNPRSNAEDFKTSMAYSPYHNVKKGGQYPPTMIRTGDHDDRVAPWHAYKTAAALQADAPDSLCLLKVEKNTGHGAGKSKAQRVDHLLDAYAFIEQTIGPINQHKYKEAKAAAQETQSVEPPAQPSWQERIRQQASALRERAEGGISRL